MTGFHVKLATAFCALSTVISLGDLRHAAAQVAEQEDAALAAPQTDAATRVMRGGRLEARGTWRTTDGTRHGVWQLSGEPPQLTPRGTWTMPLLVADDEEIQPSLDESASTEPASEPIDLTQQGQSPRVQMRRAQAFHMTRPSRVEAEGSLQGQALDVSIASGANGAMALAGGARGTLKGAKLEGTFTTPEGLPGVWEGWWHLWPPTAAVKMDATGSAE